MGHEGPEHSDVTDVNLNEPFTVEEVRLILKNLKRNKAGGADFLKNEMLINCPDDLLPLFTDFFNIVLESGLIPEDWCLGIIMPLHKDGPRANPDNYRGITLLSCLGKVFTALLNKRLKAYIDTQGGLSEAQAGFRDGYSTIDHIFSLHMLIKLYTSRKGKKLYCAFVDFKKAFDLVDRSKLWRKMIEGGMSGRVLQIIQNVYKRAKLSVRLNGTLSQSFTSNIGVLQGEILSPILFAFFLNDFEPYLAQQYPGASVDPDKNAKNIKDEELDTFLKLYVLLYADDSILLAESAEALQDALDALHEYCLLNEIIVNTDQSKEKTKIIVFSRGKIRNKPDFTYGSEPIEIVFEYTYLGIRFNYNGEFDIAIRKRIDLARTAMFGLIQKANRLGLTVDTQIELFEKTVLPIALYGCEVWGASNLKQLESFQSQFYKYILKLARFTPSCMVLGETGRLNLKSIIRTRMIGYWSRLVNGSENKIAYQVYRIAHSKHVNPESNFNSDWLAEIKDILRSINREDLWVARSFSIDLKLEHKRSRKEKYLEQWNDEINNDPRCGYYAMFKTEHAQEQYISKLDVGNALTLAQLRTNNCKNFPTNKFRFISYQWDVSCPLCDTGESGDEIHYIFRCPKFEQKRPNFDRKIESSGLQTDITSLNLLMNDDRLGHLTRLAKFVRHIEFVLKAYYEKPLLSATNISADAGTALDTAAPPQGATSRADETSPAALPCTSTTTPPALLSENAPAAPSVHASTQRLVQSSV